MHKQHQQSHQLYKRASRVSGSYATPGSYKGTTTPKAGGELSNGLNGLDAIEFMHS